MLDKFDHGVQIISDWCSEYKKVPHTMVLTQFYTVHEISLYLHCEHVANNYVSQTQIHSGAWLPYIICRWWSLSVEKCLQFSQSQRTLPLLPGGNNRRVV